LSNVDILRRSLTSLYRRMPVEDAEHCAHLAMRAVEFYFADVCAWMVDMPKPHPNQKGKGRPQIHPSQQRVHVIAELEQLSLFLKVNALRRPEDRWTITPLKGRKFLSHYAVQALLGPGLIGKAHLHQKLTAPNDDGRPWNVQMGDADVRLMKRSFDAAGRSGSVLLGVTPDPIELRVELHQRLIALSHGLSRHVPIKELRETFGPDDIVPMAARAAQAALDLRRALDLKDSRTSTDRNRPLAGFVSPAPIYALVRRILEAGWPAREEESQRIRVQALDQQSPPATTMDEWINAHVHNAPAAIRELTNNDVPRAQQRLLIRSPVKATLLEISSLILEHIVHMAPDRCPGSKFDPFIGVDANEVIASLGANVSDDDWPQYYPDIMRRICLRTLETREQCIILRDHLATLNLWVDAVRSKIWPKYSAALEIVDSCGLDPLRSWKRECEARYADGALYPRDRSHRIGGVTGLHPKLPPGFLYKAYPLRLSPHATRFALISIGRMCTLLSRLSESGKRVDAALRELAPTIPADLQAPRDDSRRQNRNKN